MSLFGVRQETLGRDNVIQTFGRMRRDSDLARGFWGAVLYSVASMGAYDNRRDYVTLVRALGRSWRVNKDDDAKQLYDSMLEYLEG